MKKFILGLLLVLGCGLLSAQTDSSITQLQLPKKARPEVGMTSFFGATANQLSTLDLIRTATRDFLEDDFKRELIPGQAMRLGYQRGLSFSYREPGYMAFDEYQPGRGFSLGNTYYSSALLQPELVELILFGNQAYEEQTLKLGPSQLESWFYTHFDFLYEWKLDSAQPLQITASLIMAHDHSDLDLRRGSLYTAADGEYLDIDTEYLLLQQETSNVLAGLGLSLGAKTSWFLNQSSRLTAEISNFGLVAFTSSNTVAVDSNFRFRGFSFNNIFDINDSLRSHQTNDYRRRFLSLPNDGYLKLTPFRAAIRYNISTEGSGREIYFSADYLHLAGYLPQLTAAYIFPIRKQHRVELALSAGGFSYAGLQLGYQARLGSYWRVAARIENFSSLLLPNLPGGALAYLNLSYQL